jgi:hypothetical protein
MNLFEIPEEILKYIFSLINCPTGYKSVLFASKSTYLLAYSENKIDQLANHLWTIIDRYPKGTNPKNYPWRWIVCSKYTSTDRLEKYISGKSLIKLDHFIVKNPNITEDFVQKHKNVLKESFPTCGVIKLNDPEISDPFNQTLWKMYNPNSSIELALTTSKEQSLVQMWRTIIEQPYATKESVAKHIHEIPICILSYWKHLTLDIILLLGHNQKDWDWNAISDCPGINMKDIEENIHLPWNIVTVTLNPNLAINFIEKYIVAKKEIPFTKHIWKNISQHKVITMGYIDSHQDYPWNWRNIALNPNFDISFLIKYRHKFAKIDYGIISSHPNITMKDIESTLSKKYTGALEDPEVVLHWRMRMVAFNPNLTFRFVFKYRKYLPMCNIIMRRF